MSDMVGSSDASRGTMPQRSTVGGHRVLFDHLIGCEIFAAIHAGDSLREKPDTHASRQTFSRPAGHQTGLGGLAARSPHAQSVDRAASLSISWTVISFCDLMAH